MYTECAHAHRHDRILSTFAYAVDAMSLRATTALALAAQTTVLTLSSTQPIAMDTAEAPASMRAHRVVHESTGTATDGQGARRRIEPCTEGW